MKQFLLRLASNSENREKIALTGLMLKCNGRVDQNSNFLLFLVHLVSISSFYCSLFQASIGCKRTNRYGWNYLNAQQLLNTKQSVRCIKEIGANVSRPSRTCFMGNLGLPQKPEEKILCSDDQNNNIWNILLTPLHKKENKPSSLSLVSLFHLSVPYWTPLKMPKSIHVIAL